MYKIIKALFKLRVTKFLHPFMSFNQALVLLMIERIHRVFRLEFTIKQLQLEVEQHKLYSCVIVYTLPN